jgi:hypothetical protein
VEDGSLSPIQSFLQLERYNGIQLVQKIHENLAALSKVIRGISLITNEIQEFAKDLLQNEVSERKGQFKRDSLTLAVLILFEHSST